MLVAVLSTMENEEERNELERFYSQNKDRLYWIAKSKLNDHREAEDAVQEVFSDIADKPEKFFDIPPNERLAYVDVMVRNVAIDMFKAKNKVPIEELNEEIEDVRLPLEDDILGKISYDELLKFMERLPEEQKDALLLHCYYGLSVYEISHSLKISMTAVKRRLTSARDAIRKFVDERNASHE